MLQSNLIINDQWTLSDTLCYLIIILVGDLFIKDTSNSDMYYFSVFFYLQTDGNLILRTVISLLC